MEIERKVTLQAVNYNNVEILSLLIQENCMYIVTMYLLLHRIKYLVSTSCCRRDTNYLKSVAYKLI